jgi:hypothetical protein
VVAGLSVATPSDDEILLVAEQVFARELSGAGQPVLRVRSDVDFDGTPSLFLTAVFPDAVELPRGQDRARLQSALGMALLALGDDRFPHMRLHHQADEDELRLVSDSDGPHA